MVTTPAEPDIGKEWTVTSKRLALQIKSYFERGFRELEITKHGEKEKTYYNIVPNIQQKTAEKMKQHQRISFFFFCFSIK
jgi:hypothetical protein